MIQNLDTAWRYPLAVIGGLLAGGYIGAMLATIYGALVFRESLNSLDPLEPWFLRWSWPALQANPDALQVMGLINGLVALSIVAVGVAGVYRGRLTSYDDAHFQSRREMRRNKMVKSISEEGFVFGKTTGPTKQGLYISATPNRFPHFIMVAPSGRGKGVGFDIPNLLYHNGRPTRRRPAVRPSVLSRPCCANGLRFCAPTSTARKADLPRWFDWFNRSRPNSALSPQPPLSMVSNLGSGCIDFAGTA